MPATRRIAACTVLAIAAITLAACGSSSSSSTSAKGTKTPTPLKAGGDWVICSDVPYPPAEFQDGSTFKGYEVEMAHEIGKRLGVKDDFQKTGFDGIIGALLAKKCDAIVSSLNDTAERRKQVAFVDYMNIGQAVAVPPKAAGTINSLDDLAGMTVAVQVGSTLKDAIDEANKHLDNKIDEKAFPDATAAAAALKTGKVDAFFADAPVVADYVNKDPGSFAMGGTQIQELPAGIAFRKGDHELIDAVQQTIDDMYADGTMKKIFAKWKVENFLLNREGGAPGTSTTSTTMMTATTG